MCGNNSQSTDMSADQVRAGLRTLLASPVFMTSPSIQRFLAFIVEAKLANSASPLKAYTLGVEVFGRPAGFDPEKDSIVRVSASRLRKMLDAYYQGEGRGEPVRILLRKGSYIPEFATPPATHDANTLGGERIRVTVERLQRIGGSAAQDYLAAGLTDELVATLSGYGNNLTVVRATIDQIPDGLPESSQPRLEYRLRGSVRSHADELRVCVELEDGTTRGVIWSETFTGHLSSESLFDMQERVARKLASTVLGPHGVLCRSLKRKPIALLGTYLAICRYHEYEERFSPAFHLSARNELEHAVRAEPDCADAWAVLADVYLGEALFGFNPTDPLPALMDKCVATAQRAIALEPQNVMANYIYAMALFYTKDKPQFLSMAEHCLRLAPHHPDNLAVTGMHLALAGDWKRGLTLVEEAMRLNPFHPTWCHLVPSLHHLHFGQYPEALAALGRFSQLDFFPVQTNLAVIHGYLGNPTEAKISLQHMFRLWPESRHRMLEILAFWFPFEDMAVVFAEGLAKAGFQSDGPA